MAGSSIALLLFQTFAGVSLQNSLAALLLVLVSCSLAGLFSVPLSYLQYRHSGKFHLGFISLLAAGSALLFNAGGLGIFDIPELNLLVPAGNQILAFPVLLLATAMVYLLAYSVMKQLLYVDRVEVITGRRKSTGNISKIPGKESFRWLDSRLIWRNGRSRITLFYSAGLFLLGGVYLSLGILGIKMPLLLGPAFLIIAFGSYTLHAFRFRSTIFDRLITLPIAAHEYVDEIVRFSQRITLASAVLIMPISYLINPGAVFFVFSMYINYLGVIVYIFTYLGSGETSRFDPALSIFSSEQAYISSHPWRNMAAGILAALPPALVVLIAQNPFHWKAGIFLLLPGILGLTFHGSIIRFITDRFERKKYEILEGFR
ncbi:MAG: hypothetical protein GF372_06570 [Candidatus Marinimicrobia bacterium]|nr:hypothetical protein [Candidatus Neomarinimicrobiota bacterium]